MRHRRRAAVLVLVALAAACGGRGGKRDATTSTTALPLAADPARPAVIVDPVLDEPNPFVLIDKGTTYLYASQRDFTSANVQVRSGRDIYSLGPVRDAMPALPPWATLGFTWAPDVRRVGDHYVMWFTAGTRDGRAGVQRPTQCIGVATSRSPLGPFVSTASRPAVCQLDRWGSIDPRTFVDRDGALWLHWKSDDNADTEGTTRSSIYAQRVDKDGITLMGRSVEILRADQAWEGRIVEAPQLVRAAGRYWLFYSGNWFNQPVYGIGVAECDGPAGPCRKPFDRAWLGSNEQGAGPGECSLYEDERGWWIVYGPVAQDHEQGTPRPVALARVAFGPDGPYLARR